MSAILVCPLSQVGTALAHSGAEWCVSLLALTQRMPDLSALPSDQRLHLALSDIVTPTPDYILAAASHVQSLLAFVERWDRRRPLLIHCYAGVSRSTAAAFVVACALEPQISEAEHAHRLRIASPTATPNRRIVALADAILGRDGRMVAAVEAIGRGIDCFEGVTFSLPVPSAALPLDAHAPQPA